MKRYLRIFLCAVLSLLIAAGTVFAEDNASGGGENESIPKLSGLFVATELCTGSNPWTAEDWKTALTEMKDAGMDKVIIQYAVQYYSDNYKIHYYTPKFEEAQSDNTGKHDQIPFALAAAKETGVKVYLGLHLAEDLWFSAMSAGFQDKDFLTSSAEYSKKVFDDLWEQFSGEYGDVIAGWYLPFEYNNSEVSGSAADTLINDFYVPLTNHIKSVTPDKKIMVSPLVYASLTDKPSEESVNNWYQLTYDILTKTKVDIIAPQDGCGWESTVRYTLPVWYDALARAVKDAKDAGAAEAEGWNNAECYNMNGTDTMTIRRLIENMAAVDEYVTSHISFSASSLLYLDGEKDGVNRTNKSYYDAYAYAAENGRLFVPENPIPTPEKAKAAVTDGVNVTLTFDKVEDSDVEMPIAGYYVFRKEGGSEDYIRIKEIDQPEENSASVIDYSLAPGKRYDYRIYAFDGTGNLSGEPAELSVTIEADYAVFDKESTDKTDFTAKIGTGVNSEAFMGDASRLNDGSGGGKIRNLEEDNAAWVGFKKTGQDSAGRAVVEITPGEGAAAGFMYIQFLNQPTLDVYLPERVDVTAGGRTLATLYPLRDYGNSPAGTVWIPIDFTDISSDATITVSMIMKYPYICLSEIMLYEAAQLDVSEDHREPENKIAGQPVMITGYSEEQNFSADSHFGGVKFSSLDFESGTMSTNYLMFKECYSTYNLTRGPLAPAMLRWTEDGDRSFWLSIADIGSGYELSVDLSSPTTVNAMETVWMYDRDAAVYLPTKIEYYGTTVEGRTELIGTAYPPSTKLMDFDKEPSADNTHIVSTETYRVVNESPDTVYTRVSAKVFPRYSENVQFISNFSVY